MGEISRQQPQKMGNASKALCTDDLSVKGQTARGLLSIDGGNTGVCWTSWDLMPIRSGRLIVLKPNIIHRFTEEPIKVVFSVTLCNTSHEQIFWSFYVLHYTTFSCLTYD